MSDNIKVVVKVRPLVKREVDEGMIVNWRTDSDRIWPKDSTKDSYTFDAVFGEDCTNDDVYEEVARPIVEAAVNGINGTIFAYGQTSSGKTYTMMGTRSSPGIIPLAVAHVFDSMNKNGDRAFFLRVSFIEIYNEKMKDLLDIKNNDLKIQEKDGCYQVTNCREVVTATPKDVMDTFEKGNSNRSVGGTLMNDASSRSHTIFKMTIESRQHVVPGAEEDDCVIHSQLNLVDLAGSERASQTGAIKERFREASHINRSLVTLSRVIRQLSDAQGDTDRFINYRDSKLTYMLQSSLGGNAKTGIICAVTPATLDETHSTLKFANCAKYVANKPIVNAVVSDAKQHKILKERLESLQKELESKKLVEEDNVRLSEKIAILKNQISIGFGKRDTIQENKYRRRTWCGPNLRSIAEDSSPVRFHEKEFDRESIKNSLMNRLSSLSEQTGDPFIRTSMTSISEDVTCLDDSPTKKNSCSPEHTCYKIMKTPPCVLRKRAEHARLETQELEEFTTLEKTFKPEETESLKRIQELTISLNEQNKVLSEFEEKINMMENENELLNKKFMKASVLHEQFAQANVDLQVELENAKSKHEQRESELLLSLEEARKNTRFTKPEMVEKILSKNASFSNGNEMFEDQVITESELDLFTKVEQYCDLEHKYNLVVKQVESLNYELKEKMDINDLLEQKYIEHEKIHQDLAINLNNANMEMESLVYKVNISTEKQLLLEDQNRKLSVENENLKEHQRNSNDKFVNLELQLNSLREENQRIQNTSLKFVEENSNHETLLTSCSVSNAESIFTVKKKSPQVLVKNENINTLLIELNNSLEKVSINNKEKEIQNLELLDENEKLKVKVEALLTNDTTIDFKYIDKVNDLNDTIEELKLQIKNLQQENDMLSIQISKTILPNELVENVQSQLNQSERVAEEYKRKLSLLEVQSDTISDLKTHLESHLSEFNINTVIVSKEDEKNEDTSEMNSIIKENEELKSELLNVTSEVQQLVIESAELAKKTACKCREQQVANSERSLLISQLAASEHYHNTLHMTCEATISYLKERLLLLEASLQNQPDIRNRLSTSCRSLFSNMSWTQEISVIEEIGEMDQSDPNTNNTKKVIFKNDHDSTIISDNVSIASNDNLKNKYDEMIANMQQKDFENSELKKNKLQLDAKIKSLEVENDDLSNNVMEYIQEVECLKKKLNKVKSDASVNTSSCNVKDISINCDIPVEDSKSIITLQELQLEKETMKNNLKSIETKNENLIVCLDELNLKCASLSSSEKELNFLLNTKSIEIESLKNTIDQLNEKHSQNDQNYKKNTLEMQQQLHNSNENTLNLQEKVTSLLSDLKIKNDELLSKEKLISSLKQQYDNLMTNYSKITSDYESEKLISDNKYQSMLEEMESVKKELHLAEENKKDLIKDCEEMTKKLFTYENASMEKQNELSNNISMLSEQIRAINYEKETLLKEKQDYLETQKVIETEKMKEFEQLESLTNNINELKSTLLLKETDFIALSNEAKETAKSSTSELEILKSDINNKNLMLQNLEVSIQEKKQEHQTFVECLVNLYKSITAAALDDSTRDNESVENNTENIVEEIQSAFFQCHDQLIESKAQLDEMSSHLEEAKSLNDAAQEQLIDTNKNIETMQNRNSDMCSLLQWLSNILCDDAQAKVDDILKSGLLVANAERIKKEHGELLVAVKKHEDCIQDLRAKLKENKNILSILNTEKVEMIEQSKMFDTKCSDYLGKIEILESLVIKLYKSISMVNGTVSSNDLKLNYENIDNDFSSYVKILWDMNDKLVNIEEEKQHVYDRLKHSDHLVEEKNELCETLKQEKKLLEKELEEMKSSLANPKLPGDYMDFFVDKMTHEMVAEKNKELQKSNEELRWKNRDLMADVRRLQHAVQNNTLNNMLPQHNEEITKLNQRNAELEKLLENSQNMEKSYIELKQDYRKCVEKCETFQNMLKEKEIEYKKIFTEKINAEKKLHEISQFNKKSKEWSEGLSSEDKTLIGTLKSTLEQKEIDYKELQTQYKELDEECEGCAKRLVDTEARCKELYTEKKQLETRLSDLKLELIESTESSAQQERKKKRQSLMDMNRGCLPSSANSSATESQENSSFERLLCDKKVSELEGENKILQNQLDSLKEKNKNMSQHLDWLRKKIPRPSLLSVACQANIESISIQKTSLKLQEQNTNTQTVIPVGGGMVLNQRLSEYIAENERLVGINNKLKELCRMRDRKIKELECSRSRGKEN